MPAFVRNTAHNSRHEGFADDNNASLYMADGTDDGSPFQPQREKSCTFVTPGIDKKGCSQQNSHHILICHAVSLHADKNPFPRKRQRNQRLAALTISMLAS